MWWPLWGSHFCKSVRCILPPRTNFLDSQAEAKTLMWATCSPQVDHFSYLFAPSASFWPLFHPTCVILVTLSPHQSRQHTHNILQLPLVLPFFQHLQSFSLFFWKKASCLLWGSHFCKSTRCILPPKTNFLDPQAEATAAIMATVLPQVYNFSYFFPPSVSFWRRFRPQMPHIGNFFIQHASFGWLFHTRGIISAPFSQTNTSFWQLVHPQCIIWQTF